MKKAIVYLFLLTPLIIFSSDTKKNNIPSLQRLAFDTCKDDLSNGKYDNGNIIPFQGLEKYFDRLIDPMLRDELFTLLIKKQNQEIFNKINFYTNNFEKHNELPAASFLDRLCYNYAFSKHYKATCQKIPIKQKGDWQKITTKSSSSGIYILSMPICGPNNFTSINHFVSRKNFSHINLTTKNTQQVTSYRYEVTNEFLYKDEYYYQHEPTYVPNKQEYNLTNRKKVWLRENQLTNKLDTFSDGSLVITHVWGGIEQYNIENNTIIKGKNFIIDNSISAASCGKKSKKLALGSYDGTITIINLEEENPNPPEIRKHGHFSDYYWEKEKIEQVHPLIVFTHKINDSTPPAITSICYDDDKKIIYFTQNNNFYSVAEESNKEILIFSTDSNINCFTIINNIIITACKDGTIFTIKNEKMINTVKHSECINSISFFNNNDSLYKSYSIITGDNAGNVIIWKLNTQDNQLIKSITLPHTFCINSVEITSDNKYIVVRGTEIKKSTADDYTTHVFTYPVPQQIFSANQDQEKLLSDINSSFQQNSNSPQELHKILHTNAYFFTSYAYDDKISELKKNIIQTLLNHLKSDVFKTSIKSINDLKNCLNKFYTQRLTGSIKVTLSGMHSDPDANPFASLDNEIDKILTPLAIDVLSTEIKKINDNIHTNDAIRNLTNKISILKFIITYWHIRLEEEKWETFKPNLDNFVGTHDWTQMKVELNDLNNYLETELKFLAGELSMTQAFLHLIKCNIAFIFIPMLAIFTALLHSYFSV